MLTPVAQRRGTWGGRREGAGLKSEFRRPVDRMVRFEGSQIRAAEVIARKRDVPFAEIVREALRRFLEGERRR